MNLDMQSVLYNHHHHHHHHHHYHQVLNKHGGAGASSIIGNKYRLPCLSSKTAGAQIEKSRVFPSENRTGIPTGSHRDPTGILNPGGIPPGY